MTLLFLDRPLQGIRKAGSWRGGLEHIDVAAARERGIPVLNVIRNAEPVADFVQGMMLCLTRNIALSHQKMHAGEWCKNFYNSDFLMMLSSHTVGLAGIGNAGAALARRLLALGVPVIAYDAFKSPEKFQKLGLGAIRLVDSLKTLFAISPSGMDYFKTGPEDVAVMTPEGEKVDGDCKPSSEVDIHRIFYQKRPDIRSVVRTHLRYASTLACLGWSIPPLHYLVAYSGREVPCIPYVQFGTYELAQAAYETMGENYAVILGNHGLLCCGGGITGLIAEEKVYAEYVFQVNSENFQAIFRAIDDEYMQARAADVADISNRFLRQARGCLTNVVRQSLVSSYAPRGGIPPLRSVILCSAVFQVMPP